MSRNPLCVTKGEHCSVDYTMSHRASTDSVIVFRLIVPRVLRCGDHHAIFQIAHNYRRGIKFLDTEAGKELVVSRALQVYKMDPKAYPDFPIDNLVWIRWPFERGAEKGLPCVGELPGIPAPLADILQGKYRKDVP